MSEKIKCRLCQSEDVAFADKKKIMNKYEIQYHRCNRCDLLFTEKPYWLEEAYGDVMAVTDTGVVERNIDNRNKVKIIIDALFNKSAVFVDWGGGYGMFTRMMRDRGYNYLWSDLYAKPLLIKGFEYSGQDVEMLTAFECFEHFEDVGKEIDRIMAISKNVVFSTELYKEDYVGGNWDYFALETGQHIAFYSEKTLNYIADKYNVFYKAIFGLHIFSKKKIKGIDIFKLKVHKKVANLFNRTDFRYCIKDSEIMKKLLSK